MSTTTNVSTLKINYLTQSQYDTALDNNQISENEFYLTPTEDMTTQEVDDFVDELEVGGSGTAVDLVVEQGTSGIWTYRKWSSGIAECWGSQTEVKSHVSTVLGGYSYNSVVVFPSGLFVELPLVTFSAYLNNEYALTGTLPNSFSTNQITLWAVCNTSGSKTTTWQVKAIGRWK
jgi:hypothetical protein